MEHIQPIIYVNAESSIRGYGLVDFSQIHGSNELRFIEEQLSAPYLVLFIEPSEERKHIESARAIYHDGNRRFTATLGSEVQNIALFLNSETLKGGELSEQISQYLSFYNEDDTTAMLIPAISDTTIRSPTSSGLIQQCIDAFVIGVVGYMAALHFLLVDDVYTSLPFHFTLPYYTVNENTLNTNMFKYMSYPATAITTHTASTISPCRILLEHILTFCNEWGPIFDEGPPMDFNPAILDTVSGYCKLTVSDLSDFHRTHLYLQDEVSNFHKQTQDVLLVLQETGKDVLETTQSRMDRVVQTFKDALAKEFAQKEEELKSRINDLFTEKLDQFQRDLQKIVVREIQSHGKRMEPHRSREGHRPLHASRSQIEHKRTEGKRMRRHPKKERKEEFY